VDFYDNFTNPPAHYKAIFDLRARDIILGKWCNTTILIYELLVAPEAHSAAVVNECSSKW